MAAASADVASSARNLPERRAAARSRTASRLRPPVTRGVFSILARPATVRSESRHTLARSMAPLRWDLPKVVASLRKAFGRVEPPPAEGPFELVLYENLAYLADDERRAAAFGELRRRVGTTPSTILAAPFPKLVGLARAGIMAEGQARKLRACADVARVQFGGDLAPLLKLPFREARKALARFPSIGEPGAEKILLLTRSHKVLALDSNGLRVLQRLGFGEAHKSYSASYRSAQEAASAEAPSRFDFLIDAHLLLRRHGKQLCRSGRPRCELCPLAPGCGYALGAGGRP